MGSALGCWLGAAVGCANLDGVDTRIDRVLSRTAARVNAATPPVRPPAELDRRSGARWEKAPATTNPPAEGLSFEEDPLPQERVIDRLENYYEDPERALEVGLNDVLRIAQDSAREYRRAEEDYILAVIRLLRERHLWGPRFFNDTTFRTGATSVDGRYESALSVINELRATQRLPYGGEVEARLVTELAQEIVLASSDPYTQSSGLILSATIPLLRDAGLIAQEALIQAERSTVYAARDFERFRRGLLVDIARSYFALIAQRQSIRNQERRLESVELLLEQRREELEEGRVAGFEVRNVQQNVLRSRNALLNAQESYLLALDRFAIRLGLPVESTNLSLEPVSIEYPAPLVTTAGAAELALSLRLDYQNDRDRLLDVERSVANARNQLLPDLDLAGSVGLGTDDGANAEESSLPAYDLDDTDYDLSITFGLPLDRELERLALRSSLIELSRSRRALEETRDGIILSARAAVREIDRLRTAVYLQELAVEANCLRRQELRIKEDEVTAQELLDAEDELLESLNALTNARRDLRNAILDYLLTTGQLRVGPDGTLSPPSGFVIREVEPLDGEDACAAYEPEAAEAFEEPPPAGAEEGVLPGVREGVDEALDGVVEDVEDVEGGGGAERGDGGSGG